MGKGGGGGGTPKIDIPQALGSNQGSLYYNAFQPLGTFGSSNLSSLQNMYNWATDIATGGNVLGNLYNQPGTGMLTGTQARTYAPFTGGTGGAGGAPSLLGPILGNEWTALMNAGTSANQLANMTGGGSSVFNQGQGAFNQGNTMLGLGQHMVREAMNKGLFPSQQAMIDQAVQSQQAAVQQQLASEGLGSSTVAGELAGQIKMSGAAAAGQLIQGNMQLGMEQQQLGISEQGMGLQGEQLGANISQALFNEYSSIANQSQAFQAQMWTEAMQGMGAIGSMMNATLQPFGYSMRTQEDVLQSNVESAKLQAGIQADQAQMASQGFSTMLGGLGSLFGQSGSGGILGLGGTGGLFGSSGLLSGLGSLGGGIGSTAGATGLGAVGATAGGAAAGGGGILAGIGALFSVFCRVAYTVYEGDPRWVLFREFLFFRAPKPLRLAYVRNASWFSQFIQDKPILKRTVKWIMNVAIWYDKATRTPRMR